MSADKPKGQDPSRDARPGAQTPDAAHPLTPHPPTPTAPRRRGRPRKAPPHKPERVKRDHWIHGARRTPTGQLLRKDATPKEIAAIMKRSAKALRKPRGATMFKRWRVDAILLPEHRDEYERLMQTPGVSGDGLHAWLLERGYDVCRSAVRQHRKAFCNQVKDVKNAARAAQAFAAVVRKEGPAVMAEATTLRLEQLMMEGFFELKDGNRNLTKDYQPHDWVTLGKATGLMVTARSQLQKMRDASALRDRERGAEQAKADFEERRKNETPEERKAREMKVPDRVAEMLGLPVWQNDEDWRYGVPKFECETFIHPDGSRRDINGRIVADSEVDEQGYLKTPPPPGYVPPGIEPLMPPVPHPRAKKQLAAVEPVARPVSQAVYEAKHAAAQKAAAEGKAYTPPKGGFAPSPPVPPPHGPAVTGAEMEQLQEKMTREDHARREADRKATERWEARENAEGEDRSQ